MVKNKDLINDIGKYHYLLVTNNKALLLSSDNNNNKDKDKALKKIESKIDRLQNKIMYKITLKTISKKKILEDKKKSIPKIGGPIVAIISIYIIESAIKLKNKKAGGNNHVYFTKKFLKKNKEINSKYIRKITYAYDKNLSNILFSINTIESIIKQLK